MNAWECPINTVARGIADPLRGYAQDGTYTLEWVRLSKGALIKIGDGEITRAGKDLGCLSGVYAEPTAAASIAGLKAAVEQGLISPGAAVVCLITGTGFKETSSFGEEQSQPEIFPPEIGAIKERFFRR